MGIAEGFITFHMMQYSCEFTEVTVKWQKLYTDFNVLYNWVQILKQNFRNALWFCLHKNYKSLWQISWSGFLLVLWIVWVIGVKLVFLCLLCLGHVCFLWSVNGNSVLAPVQLINRGLCWNWELNLMLFIY